MHLDSDTQRPAGLRIVCKAGGEVHVKKKKFLFLDGSYKHTETDWKTWISTGLWVWTHNLDTDLLKKVVAVMNKWQRHQVQHFSLYLIDPQEEHSSPSSDLQPLDILNL